MVIAEKKKLEKSSIKIEKVEFFWGRQKILSLSQKKVENWFILLKKHKFPYNLLFFI